MSYKVTFRAKGVVHYGIIRQYGPEAEKAKKRGLCLVEDAVFPRSYLVPRGDVVDVESDWGRFDAKLQKSVGGDVVEQYMAREYEKARALSASLPQDGRVRPGALFDIVVADGRASYVVVSVGARTCKVEWRGFQGDRYTDHHFGWGGSFPVRDVARYVAQAQAMRSIFGG
jgi:hypothetical protein